MDSDGKKLFNDVVGGVEYRAYTTNLKQFVDGTSFLPMFDAAIIALRARLRIDLLNSTTVDERREIYEEFYNELEGFYKEHYEAIKNAYDFMNIDDVDIKAIPYLKWFLRHSALLEHRTGEMHITTYEPLDFEFTVGLFKSAWPVYLFEVAEPLHENLLMKKIDKDTEIMEEDWDGEKPKTGIEIMRRCGECDGIVIMFAYIEDLEDADGKMFHFYAVAPDGSEVRYYEQKILA